MRIKETSSKSSALAVITAFLFFISAVSANAQTGFFYTTNNGAITIVGYNAIASSVSVPDIINGYPVTALADYSFQGKPILAVMIGSNLTTFGKFVFTGCNDLETITVSSQNAFFSSTNGVLYNKNGSTLLVCPANNSSLYSIPASVTSIGTDAFEGYFNFSNLTFSNGLLNLTNISEAAFEESSLRNITIPGNVVNIGDSAFFFCQSLTNIAVNAANLNFSSINGILYDKSGQKLIAYPDNLSGGSYEIPNTVTAIASNALSSCLNLTNITVSSSITFIGGNGFSGCKNLETITVDQQNNFYSSANGVLFDKAATTLITFPGGLGGSYLVPHTVTNVGEHAFSFCYHLTNVYFFGNPPTADSTVFSASSVKTIYYLPNTSGWGPTFAGLPTAVWRPQILTNPKQAPFGIQASQFDFTVLWASNLSVVIQSCTNLLNSSWSPVATNVLTNGIWQFSDPTSPIYAAKFYRVMAQ